MREIKFGLLVSICIYSNMSLAGTEDNLFSRYQFEENTQDYINSLHGLPYGNIGYSEGYSGKSLVCNDGGVKTLTSYFDEDWVNNQPDPYFHAIPNQSDSQTISVWFKTTDYNTSDLGGLIVGINSSRNSSGVSRFYISAEQDHLKINYGGDSGMISKELPSVVINDGLWHHAALVSHGDNEGNKEIYFDGELKLSFTGGNNGGATEGYYRICGYTLSGGDYRNKYYGSVDDFRVYSTALSASEIYSLYMHSGNNTEIKIDGG